MCLTIIAPYPMLKESLRNDLVYIPHTVVMPDQLVGARPCCRPCAIAPLGRSVRVTANIIVFTLLGWIPGVGSCSLDSEL
eukprot:gene9550-biopygen15199